MINRISKSRLSNLAVTFMEIPKNKKFTFLEEFPCPIETIYQIIGGKWRTRIIWEIGVSENGIRFSDLCNRLPGISRKVLSNELGHLEKMQILTRKEYNEFPPKVEYKLSDFGESLQPIFMVCLHWVDENIESVRQIVKERDKKSNSKNENREQERLNNRSIR